MDFSGFNWSEITQVVFAWLGALGLFGGGAAAVRSKWKQHKAVQQELEAEAVADAVGEEWKELAHVRGDKIEHLEDQVADLQSRLSNLEGKYEALMELKEQRIADRVVELINTTGRAEA